jgi:hypothetical protein
LVRKRFTRSISAHLCLRLNLKILEIGIPADLLNRRSQI